MEDLRGLMARFQTSLSDMEQRQSQGRGVAQQGLKRDIQLIQQRSVRKAVSLVSVFLAKLLQTISVASFQHHTERNTGNKGQASTTGYADETMTSPLHHH